MPEKHSFIFAPIVSGTKFMFYTSWFILFFASLFFKITILGLLRIHRQRCKSNAGIGLVSSSNMRRERGGGSPSDFIAASMFEAKKMLAEKYKEFHGEVIQRGPAGFL